MRQTEGARFAMVDAPFVLGSYRVEERLGEGGMGVVYRAFDTRRERHVALKVLGAEVARDPGYRERFRRESRLAAQLNSPHVIPIHDFGELEDGRLFIDMRLCGGTDLARLIGRDGPLGAARTVEIVSQLAHALDAAHRHAIVHRDVKPANAMVDVWGDRDFVYLVDFGIVKALSDARSTSLTGTGAFVGTPAYMAPELFAGDGPATEQADVYALGCVLHESLTGRPPFGGGSIANVIHQHLAVDPAPPSRSAPGVGPELDQVVARALAKSPRDRWRTAGELSHAARAALDRTAVGAARPVGPPGAAGPVPVGTLPRQQTAGPTSMPPRRDVAPAPGSRPLWIGGPTGPTGPPPMPPPGPVAPPPGRGSASARTGWLVGSVCVAVVLVVVLVLVWPGTTPGGNPAAGPGAGPVAADGGSHVGGLAVSPDGSAVLTVGGDSPDLVLRRSDRLGEDVTIALDDGGVDGVFRDVTTTPGGGTAITNVSGNVQSISFVDLPTRTVTGRLTLPDMSGPQEMAVTPDGRTLYVGLFSRNAVAVVDVESRTLVRTIPGAGREMALSRDGRTLVVGAVGSDAFSVIDTSTDSVVRTVDFSATAPSGSGYELNGLAVSPDGTTAYATLASDDTVRTVDLRSGVERGRMSFAGTYVRDGALSPDGSTFYVLDGSTIHVFDIASGAERTPISSPRPDATRMVLGVDAATAYVFQYGDGVTAVPLSPP